MAKSKRQVDGGRKEAPLVIAGYSESALQPRIIQPEDKEYGRYRDLLEGFFEKLIKWNEIFQDEQYKRRSIFDDKDRRDFQVLQTPTGLVIRPPTTALYTPVSKIEPERVLIMSQFIELNDPEHHLFNTEFLIRPGLAGKHLLVDPEGKPLEQVEIEVSDQRHAHSKSLTISVEYPQDIRLKDRITGVCYELGRGQIEIRKGINPTLMPEVYQTLLFSTLDALIPDTSSPIPQYEPRTGQETQISKALPLSRKRRPRR